MNLKTITTTTIIIGLGLSQPLSAQTIDNAKQTVANAKPIKVDLSNSSLPSANAKQLYIQFGIQPYYVNPLYWSWGLFFGDYYDDYYNPNFLGYRYYDDRYYRDRYYRDPYYGRRYGREYNYYYSVDRIRDIYREVLGREPDYRGLRTWLGERRSSDSLRDIRRDIARSDEAVARINQIYREVLGRDVDREGIRTWTNRLASGSSLSEVRRDIENSSEARSFRNRRYPAYNPYFNNVQPGRYIPPNTVYPPTRSLPGRNYSVPVQTFPRNIVPAVSAPNRSFPPANFSPSLRTPSQRSLPAQNYQQPTRRYSPSRNNSPTIDYSIPSRRNNGSTFSPSIQAPPRGLK
ncbi:DUF4214 domain-containing protein [Floridanema aerugineum]|uniref:DUF4214 domain-containing protein n=1 Tax=Floridaenema aerugineum BLCC-F46 TaxID=3153654 RepID=A0ABV4WYB4_9CYAN